MFALPCRVLQSFIMMIISIHILKLGESGISLKQNIGLFQTVMYGVGLILGSGIYVLIGDVAGIAGNAMWIAFIASFTGLSYAELPSIF